MSYPEIFSGCNQQEMITYGQKSPPLLGLTIKLQKWYEIDTVNMYSIISNKRTVLLTLLFGKSEKISIKRTVHLKKNLKNEIVYYFY